MIAFNDLVYIEFLLEALKAFLKKSLEQLYNKFKKSLPFA